ncbi:hypothetical protein CERZMDRAFT_84501 [Cercospora zeae-maydis SCOH1-5]|uniref:Uncharacterized protein n=1 Tax=Cercospora zeae-maydis SCOH1-5 TaxID=717836 RepID=A0A6A6FHG5_9PEZI|nr:hypothetical protein CERZMDRAFT_84501 [Cercospora zeae-maydis SCOH1-5]
MPSPPSPPSRRVVVVVVVVVVPCRRDGASGGRPAHTSPKRSLFHGAEIDQQVSQRATRRPGSLGGGGGRGRRLTLTRRAFAPAPPPSSLPSHGNQKCCRPAIQTRVLLKQKKTCLAVAWWPTLLRAPPLHHSPTVQGLSNQNQSLPTACIKLEGSDRLLEGRVKHNNLANSRSTIPDLCCDDEAAPRGDGCNKPT